MITTVAQSPVKTKDFKAKNKALQETHKVYPKWFYALVVVLTAVFTEGFSRVSWRVVLDEKQRTHFEAFLGLGKGFSPNLIWNYIPHHYLVYTLNPKARVHQKNMWGVEQPFYINSIGFRGKEISVKKPAGTYRIACLGGSTTFGYTEPDESKTYPALLEASLNDIFKGRPRIEVINAGTPGWTTAETLMNFHFKVLELEPDMVIVYEGINDTFAMRHENEGNSDYSTFRRRLDYRPPSPSVRPLLNTSAFFRWLYYPSFKKYGLEVFGNVRQSVGSQEQEMRNLNTATGKYFRRNMESLVDIALARKIVPIIMTVGHGPWHPSLGMCNQIVREIAHEKRIPLIDFEPLSKPEYFAPDNVHLLRPGNEIRAKLIVDFLMQSNFKEVVKNLAK